jgi:hypothetical protein
VSARPDTARLGLGIDPDPLFADLIEAIAAASRELGIEPVLVGMPAAAAGLDRLLLVGRPGRFRPFLDSAGGPPRTVWTGEPLPRAPEGPRTTPIAGRRSMARRAVRPIGATLRRVPLPSRIDRRRVSITTDRLTRANLDELAMAAAGGAELVVTSRDRGECLAAWGLAARVVPFGYHERHAGPLTPAGAGPRDVPLLLLGSRAAHTRRATAVDRLRRGGAGRGLRIADGTWGSERERLLRRTRVMVDVHRIPGNFVGLRLLLSLAAGVALVTEPMTDPSPFVPGIHYLEAPLDDLLDVALALDADEPRRATIVEAGQALLRDHLTMRSSLEGVLAAGLPG